MTKHKSYKPSGIEWLETIPENWEVSKLKYLGNLYGGLTGKSGGDFNNNENLKNKPYIPYTNIFNNTYISKDHFHYVSIDDGENQNRVKKFDMFFLMSSETHKDLGKSCILVDDVEELYLNSFCKGYRITNKNVDPLFLNYQILGHLHRELISVEGKGFTRINLRQDKINDLIVFYPPIQEQKQIVNYLDEKTSIIDNLISIKQRKVELLKEQRTTLINQVITKGLNPNVKMKDSGVEWIGDIPIDWDVVKIKYVTNQVVDGTHFTPNYIDTGIPFLRVTDIQTEKIDLEKVKFISKVEHENLIKRCNPKRGDILLSKNGTIGITKVIDWDWEFSIFVSLCLIKFKDNFNPYLFSYFFESDIVNQQIFESSKKTSVSNLHLDKIRELLLIKPSIEEQIEIVEYLDKHTKDINDLILIETKKIELLKEYRQSLISEVITGKIKVSD